MKEVSAYKNKLQFIINKGLIHLFGASFINSMVSFLSNVFVVRLLSKADYGIFGYVVNLVGFFVIFNGAGATHSFLQYCSENRSEEEKKNFEKFSLEYGCAFSILLSLLCTAFAIFSTLDVVGSRNALILFSWFPLINYLYDYCGVYLRTKQMNKLFSLYTNINSVSNIILTIMLSILFGVNGTILARYFGLFISVLFIFITTDLFSDLKIKLSLKYKDKVQYFKYGTTVLAGNVISELLYLLDVFLIGKILKNSEIIASYKISTLIPTALLFIPNNIILFVYPYFAKNNNNKAWIYKHYLQVLKILLVINGVVSLLLFIFAPFIISFLWGNDYLDAVVPFRILAINYFIQGTFRSLTGNVLAILRKVKINLIVNFITGILNIIFDIVLIYKMGANGAALATLGVVIFSSVLYVGYFYKYCKKE